MAPSMRDRTLALFVLGVSLAGCSGDGDGDAAVPLPPRTSDNVIDRALEARLTEAGISPPDAPTDELCRRMSLDLLGVVPTPEERRRWCDGKTPGQMADALLTSPGFAENEVRFWIRRLGEDAGAADARYLLDADGILRSLARGELSYDDFAAEILAHPVMTMLRSPRGYDFYFPGEDGNLDTFDRRQVGAHAIRVFLGRAPVGDEAEDLGNLFRVWSKTLGGEYLLTWQALLDPALCDRTVLGAEACTSRRFGEAVSMELPLASPVLYEMLLEPIEGADERELGSLPLMLREPLERPGRLLAGRPEFWDEAADLALARFTGWWRSTFDQTRTDLPEVRAALAGWFRDSDERDLRALYRTVVTSTLYRAAAGVDAAAELPPWAHGPTKPMSAEQWLDSASRGVGRPMVRCEPHTDEDPDFPDFFAFFPLDLRDPEEVESGFEYYRWGTRLGGCTGGQPGSTDPGLRAITTQDLAATALCAAPPREAGSASATDDDVARLFRHQAEHLLGRAADDEEIDAAVEAGRECRAGGECEVGELARQLCAGLIRSAAFFYY
jgi:hypothetical protein